MVGSRPLRLAASVALCVLLALGCGREEEASEGAWTVEEGALTLERDLLVGDDESFFFAGIWDVTTGPEGRIYVAEGEAAHVKVLSPDGMLQDSLGRKGKGPGEFQEVSKVVVARPDSLYVLDDDNGQVSVFSPDGNFVYSLARDKTGDPDDLMVPREGKPGFIFVNSPRALRAVKNDAPYTVRSAEMNGKVGDTLFTARPYQMALKELDRGMHFARIPFARNSHFAFGSDGRIHYAWSDSLSVATYDPSGRKGRTIDVPFEPVPVTEEEIERVLKDRSRARGLVRDGIPATKPAFDHFLVDDEGRYWFGRPTANPDSTDWWVADPDEKQVATTTLPSEVELEVVKNGRAYGQTTTENGAPAVVRYRIRDSSK